MLLSVDATADGGTVSIISIVIAYTHTVLQLTYHGWYSYSKPTTQTKSGETWSKSQAEGKIENRGRLRVGQDDKQIRDEGYGSEYWYKREIKDKREVGFPWSSQFADQRLNLNLTCRPSYSYSYSYWLFITITIAII